MDIEEMKQKYEKEIERLNTEAQVYQKKCQEAFDSLETQKKQLVTTFNEEMQRITIGIERLRGAYTALCDMQENKEPTLISNGMEVTEAPQVENNTPVEEISNHEEVADDSAAVGVEPQVENKISDEVKSKAKDLVSKAKKEGKVTKYDDFVKTDLAKETSLSDEELEALSKITAENTTAETTPIETTSNVNEEEVPDYLKEQYGLK